MVLATVTVPGPSGTPIPLVPFGTAVVDNLNEIIDEISPVLAPWTTYTPAWTSDGAPPAIVDGVLTGSYVPLGLTGNVGFFNIVLTFGPATDPGTGFYSLGLPPGWTSGPNSAIVGTIRITNAASSFIGVVTVLGGATTVSANTHGVLNPIGNGFPISPVNGDTYLLQGVLELA